MRHVGEGPVTCVSVAQAKGIHVALATPEAARPWNYQSGLGGIVAVHPGERRVTLIHVILNRKSKTQWGLTVWDENRTVWVRKGEQFWRLIPRGRQWSWTLNAPPPNWLRSICSSISLISLHSATSTFLFKQFCPFCVISILTFSTQSQLLRAPSFLFGRCICECLNGDLSFLLFFHFARNVQYTLSAF